MFPLQPACDVEVGDGRFVATSSEPWLTLVGWPTRWAGRFVEITYRLSLLDEPVRPLLRFRLRDGTTLHRIAPAPVLGAAIWIGRLPAGTVAIDISPTNRSGPFDFRIERLRMRSWPDLVWRGLRTTPRPARSAVLTRLIGWRDESDVNLAWAIGATRLEDYRVWAKPRVRGFEPDEIDRPRGAVAAVEIVRLGEVDIEIGLDDSSRLPSPQAGGKACDPHEDVGNRPGPSLIIGADDQLLPGALAYIAEQADRYPHARLFYGDTLQGGSFPCLRPGWSLRLQTAQSFLRPPLVVRGLAGWTEAERTALLASGELPRHWVASLADDEIRPLRRLLAETCDVLRRAPSPAGGRRWPDDVGSDEGQREKAEPASSFSNATIIIPTRDHPALLRCVIASIRAHTSSGIRIIVVDNASVTDAARDMFAALDMQPDIDILPYPGRFNFSAICNAAAASADTDVLVFLNDDTEVLTEGWLDRLSALAMQPGVGAVGARLTYPDGRLQHVGVVAGLGESAGHFGALEPAGTPGWAGRNLAIHEVSAVTGACLAVERRKFEAVGGFDAVHLPVELSDIDLCFKLNARGWQTLVDPFVHLLHAESASRGGATFRRLAVHAGERQIFCDRWRHVLRDDPFFHPALSLYSLREALG